MKRLHLVCNAHIDPVWQWEWEEGAAEALSTFRIAADFCDEYEHFVFCHNEALLYRWIEEYDAELFEHIRRLVAEGKWCIMGGWHLQPDCNMPSGEAMVRQILEGRKYFKEKFGVVPKVAVNVDPFGHSRGLVQILKKSGYEGYLFMRPGDVPVPTQEFIWKGYDGSEVVGIKIRGGYGSGKGSAASKIRSYIDACAEDDFMLCLWGIGNHGGGPSKKDLDDIDVLTAEMAEKGTEIIHSTPEEYLAEVKEKRELGTFDKSLNSWAPGCYTSQIRIKQKYRAAENAYFMTEIMASHANTAGLMGYPDSELAEAMYDITTVQFHDMLPGSSVQPAEEMAVRMLDHAIEILTRVRARAFFALSAGQKKAPADKIPVFAYNPYPYAVEGDFRCEFMLWDQYWGEGYEKPILYTADGKELEVQCEKENSNIPLEWRKRIVFHTTLAPMSLSRFECAFELEEKKPAHDLEHDDDNYYFRSGEYEIVINRHNGLVDKYARNGIDYTSAGAFSLEVWKDTTDPWYMTDDRWHDVVGRFELLDTESATEFCHTNKPLEGVHVIESGSVRTVVEAVFGFRSSRAVVKYYLSPNDGLSIDVRIIWIEKQLLVKLNVPAAFDADCTVGEHIYGREKLFDNLKENVSQKYTAMCGSELALAVSDNGIYGSAFDNEKRELKLTLLRSPAYTAHPIGDRPTVPQDRYMPYIEQGERDYSFAVTVGNKTDVMRTVPQKAQCFNMQPMLLSFYPTGRGELPMSPLKLDTDRVTLNAFKRAENGEGFIARLFNPTEESCEAVLTYFGNEKKFAFGPFEIKTVMLKPDSTMEETDLMEGYAE